MSESHLRLVKEVYEAYDRGDVEAVFARLGEDIIWTNPYPPHVPLSGAFRGHEGFRRFLHTLRESTRSLAFEPRELIAQGDRVVVLGWEKVMALPTGRTYENTWVHVWTVRDGKARDVRTYGDTAAVGDAFRTSIGGS